MIGSVTGAEALFAHDGDVAAITGAASLRLEHVEIVALVVAQVKTLGAKRHAGTHAARPTPISNCNGGEEVI